MLFLDRRDTVPKSPSCCSCFAVIVFSLVRNFRYIQSHLDYAGEKTEIFTDRALDAIHESSSGIPRMINRGCEKSLMYAFQQGKRLIDEHIVFYVVEHEMLESSIPHGERSR